MIARYQRSVMDALWSDQHRFDRWLEVECLALEAWEKLGVVPEGVADRVRVAKVSPERVDEFEATYHHDVLAFISTVGEQVAPEDARYIHYGLTSTDVVDSALASILVEALDIILTDLRDLRQALRVLALEHRYTPTIGRTHGMHAEPTSFGLKAALWWLELGRNEERVRRAQEIMRVMKLSGAVGNFANLPPEVEAYVADRLGLTPAPIATQVLQRDRHAEVVTSLAILGGTLDKMATEIRHLQRSEVGEVEEPFQKGQRGSSAMPHKRNPVKCEQISGQARVLRGYAVAALEDQPLWHERDISHSSVERIILPDATTLMDYMLWNMTRIIRGLTVKPERMMANLELSGGLVFSERVLLGLVEHGMTREEAYRHVQAAAMAALSDPKQTFRERLKADPEIAARLSAETVESLFSLEPYLKNVDILFARSGILDDRATPN